MGLDDCPIDYVDWQHDRRLVFSEVAGMDNKKSNKRGWLTEK